VPPGNVGPGLVGRRIHCHPPVPATAKPADVLRWTDRAIGTGAKPATSGAVVKGPSPRAGCAGPQQQGRAWGQRGTGADGSSVAERRSLNGVKAAHEMDRSATDMWVVRKASQPARPLARVPVPRSPRPCQKFHHIPVPRQAGPDHGRRSWWFWRQPLAGHPPRWRAARRYGRTNLAQVVGTATDKLIWGHVFGTWRGQPVFWVQAGRIILPSRGRPG